MVVEDVEEIKDGEEESKKQTLLIDFKGFRIYRAPRSFIVKKPESEAIEGYFTTLSGCVKEISKLILIEKLGKRDKSLKSDVESTLSIVEEHDKTVEELVGGLEITVRDLK